MAIEGITSLLSANVIKGPAAIGQVGHQMKYWVGVASGNRYCRHLRRTPERAIEDAEKIECGSR